MSNYFRDVAMAGRFLWHVVLGGAVHWSAGGSIYNRWAHMTIYEHTLNRRI